MSGFLRASAILLTLVLSGCMSTRQVADLGFRPPSGNYKLLVMQPDISVGVLTTGGAVEPRADWTNQARENIYKALVAQQLGKGGQTKVAATRDDVAADPTLVQDLIWLHQSVGQSILLHKYLGQTLPTKDDKFDWTLGHPAVDLGAATQQDYALFLYARDSFSSGGRMALQMAAAVGCGFGVCSIPTGGAQSAFASLVDLKTGRVVWFNTLASERGDIRTPEGAAAMIRALLGDMQPGALTAAVP